MHLAADPRMDGGAPTDRVCDVVTVPVETRPCRPGRVQCRGEHPASLGQDRRRWEDVEVDAAHEVGGLPEREGAAEGARGQAERLLPLVPRHGEHQVGLLQHARGQLSGLEPLRTAARAPEHPAADGSMDAPATAQVPALRTSRAAAEAPRVVSTRARVSRSASGDRQVFLVHTSKILTAHSSTPDADTR